MSPLVTPIIRLGLYIFNGTEVDKITENADQSCRS